MNMDSEMLYKIISTCTPNAVKKLEEEVNRYLSEGWELSGGIAYDSTDGFAFQAIIKR